MGARITAHPVPRKISFTGSVATGGPSPRGRTRAETGVLELGGNDPAILLDDVDPAAMATASREAAFQNNGQVCSADQACLRARDASYEEIVEALAAQAGSAKVGDGTRKAWSWARSTTIPQFERVSELVPTRLGGASPAAGGRARSTGTGTSTSRPYSPASRRQPDGR